MLIYTSITALSGVPNIVEIMDVYLDSLDYNDSEYWPQFKFSFDIEDDAEVENFYILQLITEKIYSDYVNTGSVYFSSESLLLLEI